MKFSIYLAAFLPWGVLAPLNVIKLMLNAVSPTAHFWVPKETEQCQGACGIARMWAQLFWSLQFISALSFVYVHYHREQTGLVHMGIATKLVVGLLLLKAYASGVIHWPIGLGGPCLDWALALGFALELRSRKIVEPCPRAQVLICTRSVAKRRGVVAREAFINISFHNKHSNTKCDMSTRDIVN